MNISPLLRRNRLYNLDSENVFQGKKPGWKLAFKDEDRARVLRYGACALERFHNRLVFHALEQSANDIGLIRKSRLYFDANPRILSLKGHVQGVSGRQRVFGLALGSSFGKSDGFGMRGDEFFQEAVIFAFATPSPLRYGVQEV